MPNQLRVSCALNRFIYINVLLSRATAVPLQDTFLHPTQVGEDFVSLELGTNNLEFMSPVQHLTNELCCDLWVPCKGELNLEPRLQHDHSI